VETIDRVGNCFVILVYCLLEDVLRDKADFLQFRN
jgi:hypothetical protein